MPIRSLRRASLRQIFISFSVLLIGLALTAAAHAHTAVWPTTPIKIVVTKAE